MEREFVVGEGREEDFFRAYGPSGLWEQVLSGAVGFVSTEVRCEAAAKRMFRTVDVWVSHQDFEAFRSEHHAECERVGRFAADEGIVIREVLLGTYYDDGPDDAGLVIT